MNASVFYTQLTYCTLRSCNYHCVSRVFIYFYLQVWNCGVWCFDFDFFFFFSLGFSLSLFCIITTLVFFIISLSLSLTVVLVNPTSAKLYQHTVQQFVGCDTLIGKYLWAPVLFVQEKHLESNIPPKLKVAVTVIKSRSWTQVRAIYTF